MKKIIYADKKYCVIMDDIILSAWTLYCINMGTVIYLSCALIKVFGSSFFTYICDNLVYWRNQKLTNDKILDTDV